MPAPRRLCAARLAAAGIPRSTVTLLQDDMTSVVRPHAPERDAAGWRAGPRVGGPETELEPTDGVEERVVDSNSLVTEPLIMLSRADATDFPPLRTGIPVRPSDAAVGSVLAVPVVFDEEGFLTAEILDGAAVAGVLLSWTNGTSFVAFSSFSKDLTFSSAAVRNDAILSCLWTTDRLGLGPVGTVA